ncbi:glycerate kinase [Blastococcus haudaquaticus]|uniref:Glycerate kinase n=1 Tax=Blastococcus haudaquaticus TaxID=1938745 RepID=A0A286H7V3_9ACTN|nr:glycerate kinase [Blastococcus haudaquaticus]SOE03847.1 glycerate kinase [Blastococcus haudaquaticus]
MRTLLAAPDKFRGSATAPEVTGAIAAAAAAAGWACVQLPLADGGEGTLDAFGGANRASTVTGPLGTPVEAPWRMGGDRVAVIESARASGLDLAGGARGNDPVAATSRGTGELVAAALAEGATRVIVSLGGSATTDGGFDTVELLEASAPFDGREGRAEVLVACDVRTPFRDAAVVFGPQKGASPEQIVELTGRLDRLSSLYRQRYGVDLTAIPGSGAAGGLGGALAALGARLVPGFELVAAHTGLADAVRAADAVVTGEGKLDAESFNGKVVGGVLALAEQHGVPALVVAGAVDQEVAGRVAAVSLLDEFGSEASWGDPLGCVTQAATQWLGQEWTTT